MNNIVPLKALAQSGDPWGSTGGYPPNAGGGGGYGGGGYSGGGQGGGGGYGYGYGGPGYGAYQNQAYEFGYGLEWNSETFLNIGANHSYHIYQKFKYIYIARFIEK
jgi:hypothetical protein